MSLQLILGGSGSGKTTCLYDRVIQASMEQPRRQFFVIVPEQFTMQAQKDIVVRHPRHGTMNIDIVSFQRLAYRVFEELSIENLQILDDMGKSMVLRKVAASERRKLVLFQGHLNQTGFINQMKSMISEFYQYGITPEILKELAPEAKSALLRQKLLDFSLVFEAFQEYISGHYITTEEVLDVLCRVLPRSGLIKNSVIALDGYTGFTPVQYRLLELFMVCAKQVVVTVTVDPTHNLSRTPGMQELFYMSHQMIRRLEVLAEKNQVSALEPVKLTKSLRFPAGSQLAALEAGLFRYRKAQTPAQADDSVELYQAASPQGEIAHMIRRMQELIRREGIRYRDMAVITGDLNNYGREIAHQFEQNGIPCFLDDKKNVLDNPLVELIRSALEVVRRDFSYESVFRFLRTGLVTEEAELIDRLENYVIALGIRGGKRYRETWERTYRNAGELNLMELNAFKDQTLAPLFAMQETFRQKDISVREMVSALFSLLEACHAEEQLQLFKERFMEEREYRLAKEYDQIYERTGELLTRLSELLGEEQVSRKEFMEILDAGFAEITLGVIPAVVDRVVVGDITRTRLAHIKVLFFVGVNDGIIPVRKDGKNLLSDQEREFFGAHQLELAPSAREDSFQQRFYLYLMMTKPSERLLVSYSNLGADGKSRRPSYLIGELKKILPELACTEEIEADRRVPYSLFEAKQELVKGLRGYSGGENQQQFLELYRYFLQNPDTRRQAFALTEAACYRYEKQGIGHAAAQALYGKIISGSVTRLEQYAACAYAHFLKYGLELSERQRYELAASDMGNLFHDSIDLCFKQMQQEHRDWRTVTDEERTALVRQCVERVTAEYGNTILNSSARNAYLAKRVEHITQRTVWALQQQLIRGDFQPTGFEVSFSAADDLKAMKISLSEEEALYLRGRVDRLDTCDDGERIYVKIIDYKSGSTSFDLLALYHGLQLQLVIYMDAVLEMTKKQHPDREVLPAGILYYNISDPLVEKAGKEDDEDIDAAILRSLRMNGLINSELDAIRHLDHTIEKESDIIPVVLKDGSVQENKSSVANRKRFEILQSYVLEKAKQSGRQILDGEIGAAPYKYGTRTACDYCPYHAVCGFDKKTDGYDYRRWKNRKSEEIWEELCQKTE